ncbi:MAG: ABC transporter ATP-binding protein, partial [Planctomycetia bacterium]|nr:ABC transporter ATP-binding protein [Planctomycetia bacterium]
MTFTPIAGTTSPISGNDVSCGMAEGLRVEMLAYRYGVRGVSFAIPAGTFFVLLGESGCGKTTLLKMLGGYLTPTDGTVWLGGR